MPEQPPPRDPQHHWNERYRRRGPTALPPSPYLVSLASRLPAGGQALDVGGGSGRNACWLAAQGFDVTVVDIAEEGLALARAAAQALGLSLTTVQRDLERDGLPDGAWDVIVCMHFLHRPLFPQWAAVLRPGGVLVFEQPTRSNLERHAKPSARFLLEDGELPHLVHGLVVLDLQEGWNETGRHEARLLARRPRL